MKTELFIKKENQRRMNKLKKSKLHIYFVIAFLILVSLSVKAQNGFRLNKTEFFTISTSIDPSASIKEKGIDIVGEIEYAGSLYVKAGFESFSALYGGYTDVHGAVGINFTSGYFDTMRYYAGVRTACVFRDGGFGVNFGLEYGIDYNISDNLFIGVRATYDRRNEQETIFGWEPETKFSGFVRIGYRWDFRK